MLTSLVSSAFLGTALVAVPDYCRRQDDLFDSLSLCLRWEVKLFVKATRLQSSKCLHPKILPAEEGKADLLFCHCSLVLYLLNYYYSEVLKRVVLSAEVLIDFDGVFALGVIPVLIYAPVGLLGLQFAHVLSPIGASVAPGEVNGIFGTTACSLAYLEPLLPGSVCENVRVDHM